MRFDDGPSLRALTVWWKSDARIRIKAGVAKVARRTHRLPFGDL